MSAGEFDLIKTYFKSIATKRKDVQLGIGDDAAITSIPAGHKLVTTVDTLVENIHFVPDVDPADLACKALAVNLSDLAAMGAEPAWITLSLTIPEINHQWLASFSSALQKQCHYYDVQLIGGDTCRGRISITIQAMGLVPEHMAIRRSTAQAGDLIYVTGNLGDAGAGLQLTQQQNPPANDAQKYLLGRLNQPTPRLETGIHLRQLATSAIDISDGLVQDLQHILDASDVGAVINMNQLPLSEHILSEYSENQARGYALTAGDDYELCFTVNPQNKEKLERTFVTATTPITLIGYISANKGLQVKNHDQMVEFENRGYDHFRASLKV